MNRKRQKKLQLQNTKFVFVTGGVCSSLGKGIVAASSGAILKSGGKKVSIMKLDPYLNVDPGTMSPFQHGEVFVLDDGSETDLDLGHYERFIDEPLQKECTITTGRVYKEVLEEEREGKYLGGTIQVVPHITGKIREKIELAAEKTEAEVMIIEIGGTVGDIEGEPFLEVIREMRLLYGKNVLSMHLTLLPYLQASGELKTKPTQLSVQLLRSKGIHPHIIFARSDKKIPKSILKKISFFCDVDEKAVIPAETVDSIYEVPLRFESSKLGEILAEKLELKNFKTNLNEWQKGFEKIKNTKNEISIGIAGKYNALDDAYISVVESIKSAGLMAGKKTKIEWIDTTKIEEKNPEELQKLKNVAGVILPGGFGNRGIEGKIFVANYCRIHKKPYLGLCLGSQIMAIEFARNVLGIKKATSEEFDMQEGSEKNPVFVNGEDSHVIHFMEKQRTIRKKGGTMRLGSYECAVKKDTKAFDAYQTDTVHERHRHRYEFNNSFREKFEANGFIISGVSPNNELVEIVEIKNHPFMMGTQFHPEFLSRPWKPHPLFREFLKACI